MLQYQNRLVEISKFCNAKLQFLIKKMKVAAKDLSLVDQIQSKQNKLPLTKNETLLKEE